MKRKAVISAVLALILILSLAACGGGGSNGKSIAKDDHVMALKFTAPESYESVERYSEKKVSGELIEKDITFATEDGSKLVFACMPGRKLSELADTSSWEVINKGGQDYYMYSSGGSLMAFAQVGDDMYAISIDGGNCWDSSRMRSPTALAVATALAPGERKIPIGTAGLPL